ncbi:VOC family protein [Nocardioides donggukensis]|uniref:VOC family protein n=1 Tax=Nocardioides donggukensis TaxID=2774019 RepID=A0A927Q2J3_9ACTN|nr:VOC family protein [Nocardioides donggukensis]MBD8870449.1 VOC family protein [Nocardioides donggukensis]
MSPFWISAFLDLTTDDLPVSVPFWRAVTGYRMSPPRGGLDEFASLLPADGDDFLRVQRVVDGPCGIHLDLHVQDPRTAADQAVSLGATEVVDEGYVVLRSPGGMTFCLVSHPASRRPAPVDWGDGATSLVDQVCLDIPAEAFDAERDFWIALTGWQPTGHAREEYLPLFRPAGIPLRLLLQRLDEPSGPVRAHLDLASDDRAAEVRRHVGLGAVVEAEQPTWTLLRDPAGAAYCVTDRLPETGLPREAEDR